MAAPSYTSDLTAGLITNAESGTWGEITGYVGGGSPVINDTDYFIQGVGCTTQSPAAKTGLQVSMYFDYGSDLASVITAGKCVFFWQVVLAGNAMETFDNGGLRLGIGSSPADFKQWKSGGKDFGRNPYGGWQNIAIDPRYEDPPGTPFVDYTINSPTGVWRYFCSHPNLVASIKAGNLHALDAIRYGRGDFIVTGGDGEGYATFAGMAAKNDANDATNGYNRWGLFQQVAGNYLWKGLISLGTSGTAVDFRDSNRNIVIDDTPRTYASFNRIEINNAGSRVDWTTISIIALGTLSKGQFAVINDCDVNIDSCAFTDMSTFVFQPTSTILDTIFRRCGQITQGAAVFDGCLFTNSVAAVNLLVNDIGKITNNEFISAGTGHAVEYRPTGAGPFNVDWSGNQDSLYAATDGSTNNETILIHPVTNSADITLNVIGGSSTPTIMLHADYTGIFTKVINPVLTKITVRDVKTFALVDNARVLLEASDNTGDLHYQIAVDIESSGGTATVTHTAHGLETGDLVHIKGCTQPEYNIVASITYIGVDSYSYAISGTPDSPATGSPTCTGVIFNDLTVSGIVSDQRSWNYNQPVVGRVRKSTSSPLYQNTPISETINKDDGLAVTAYLIPDE